MNMARRILASFTLIKGLPRGTSMLSMQAWHLGLPSVPTVRNLQSEHRRVAILV